MKFSKILIFLFLLMAVFLSAKDSSAAVIRRAPNNLGLVGYWSFNEGTSTVAQDYSGNKANGTLTGSTHLPSWADGKLGKALSLDGTEDFVNVSGVANRIASGAITYCAWIKFNSVFNSSSNPRSVFKLGDLSSTNDVELVFGFNGSSATSDGKLYLNVSDDSPSGWWQRLGSNRTVWAAETWYFIVGVADATNLYLYVNGTLESQQAYEKTRGETLATVVSVGKYWTQYYFLGVIDEPRIYNRALSAAEVFSLYKSGLSQLNPSAQNISLTNGLVGLWSFNGQDMNWASSTAEALDRSPSAGSGQANNGNVIGPRVARGQVGQSLSFDGENDYVSTASDPYNFTGDFSISAWAKLDALGLTTSCKTVMSKAEAAQYGIENGCTVNNKFNFSVRDGTAYRNSVSNDAATVDTWYYLVGVVSGTDVVLYVNGIAQTTHGTLDAGRPTNDYPLSIGVNPGATKANYFYGLIDEVRVYNRALSQSEITQLYKLGAAKLKLDMPQTNLMKDGSLVGYWSFNGPDVSNVTDLVYDRSGNGYNGTMKNMATSSRYARGKAGQALKFDGTNDYVKISSLPLNGLQQVSITYWFKVPPYAAAGVIDMELSANSNSYPDGSFWQLSYSNGSADSATLFTTSLYGAGPVYCQARYSAPSVGWHFFAFIYDRTKETQQVDKVYVDGVAQTLTYALSSLGGGTTFRTDDLYLMSRGGTSEFVEGTLDEIRIYSRLLSEPEVLRLYKAGKGQ